MKKAKSKLPPITDAEEAAIQNGIARDRDNPEWTKKDFARARPAKEVLPPELYAAFEKRKRGQRGPGKKPTRVSITLRLDADVAERWRASGPGWQTRMGEALRKARVVS